MQLSWWMMGGLFDQSTPLWVLIGKISHYFILKLTEHKLQIIPNNSLSCCQVKLNSHLVPVKHKRKTNYEGGHLLFGHKAQFMTWKVWNITDLQRQIGFLTWVWFEPGVNRKENVTSHEHVQFLTRHLWRWGGTFITPTWSLLEETWTSSTTSV